MNSSVAICTYNGAKYLADQLDSILNQSYQVLEVVVCDDASADSTWEIITKYAESYPEIFKIYRNPENIGYVKNFEKAIRLCTNDVVYLCDQDDIWLPNKVEVMNSFLEENPHIEVAAHKIAILNGNQVSNNSFWNVVEFHDDLTNDQVLELLLFKGNVFPGMSMAVTRSGIKKYLPLRNINSVIIHDYELAIRACNDNTFGILNTCLAYYRQHSGQVIGISMEGIDKVEKPENLADIHIKLSRIRFVKEAVSLLELNPELVNLYLSISRNFYKKYLKTLKFPINLLTHLKAKYYYKILNGIR